MPGLDAESRKMILDTLGDFAQENLPLDYLLKLDHDNAFPTEIMQQLHDPDERLAQLGRTRA